MPRLGNVFAARDREYREVLAAQFGGLRADGLPFERHIERVHRPDPEDLDFCRRHGFFRLLIPTDGLWHGAIFYLEPTDFLNAARAAGRARAGNPFFADQPPPAIYVGWVIAWLASLLALANVSFAKRDL